MSGQSPCASAAVKHLSALARGLTSAVPKEGLMQEVCDAGLVAVMLLLGFGLVRIPRTMLQEADPTARLAYAHHKCAALCLCFSCLC